MRMQTLGLMLIIVGMVGASIASLTGMFNEAIEYYKVGIFGNVIQVIGMAFIIADKD